MLLLLLLLLGAGGGAVAGGGDEDGRGGGGGELLTGGVAGGGAELRQPRRRLGGELRGGRGGGRHLARELLLLRLRGRRELAADLDAEAERLEVLLAERAASGGAPRDARPRHAALSANGPGVSVKLARYI